MTVENVSEYENVKDCICEMAETVFQYSPEKKEKKSESIDGYSVSYVNRDYRRGQLCYSNEKKAVFDCEILALEYRTFISGGGIMLTNTDITIYSREYDPSSRLISGRELTYQKHGGLKKRSHRLLQTV